MDLNPAWSPDGRWLVFDRGEDSADGERELIRVAPDGRGLKRLAPGTAASEAAWFSDGSRFVATVARARQTTALGLFAADGRLLRLLTRARASKPRRAASVDLTRNVARIEAASAVTRGDETESVAGPGGLLD